MGRAECRKRDDLAYETFDGAGCSSGLQLELASGNESGYAGVFPTTSGRWQATVRVEREGKKVRRNVGSFHTREEAAVQRSLATAGFVDVASPVSRAKRSKGVHMPEPANHTSRLLPHAHRIPLLVCRRRLRGGDFARTPGHEPDRHALQRVLCAHRTMLGRAAGGAMWGCWLCAAVCGGAIDSCCVWQFGKAAMQDGRAEMVPGKGADGGTGDARFELGPTPLTPLRPLTTAHALRSQPTPQFDDGPAPGIDRGTGGYDPCSGAVHGANSTRVVSYTCSPLRARM